MKNNVKKPKRAATAKRKADSPAMICCASDCQSDRTEIVESYGNWMVRDIRQKRIIAFCTRKEDANMLSLSMNKFWRDFESAFKKPAACRHNARADLPPASDVDRDSGCDAANGG